MSFVLMPRPKKLDNNDDHGNAPVYEVEFQGHDAEVKIHAETGEVLGVDG